MGVGMMHTTNQKIIFKRIQKKILHDESSNTTLGGMVKLDKQREQ
jgi:hypothetical protein